MELTIEKAIELVYKALPYSNQIQDIDLQYPGYVYLTWRGERLKITLSTSLVHSIEERLESCSNIAMLVEKLIKQEYNN